MSWEVVSLPGGMDPDSASKFWEDWAAGWCVEGDRLRSPLGRVVPMDMKGCEESHGCSSLLISKAPEIAQCQCDPGTFMITQIRFNGSDTLLGDEYSGVSALKKNPTIWTKASFLSQESK